MKAKIIILFIFTFSAKVCAQITDVFTGKTYKTSTYQVKFESDKPYITSKLEFYHDKTNNPADGWTKTEKQLEGIVKKNLENESAFFLVNTRAVNLLKNQNERRRLQGGDPDDKPLNPRLKSVEILLYSVVNNFGTYAIKYDFDDVEVSDFYLADYQNSWISSLDAPINKNQQQILQKVLLPEITATYLLKTEKLSLQNVDRIQSVRHGKENTPDLSVLLDWDEAKVFPYFSGLMVEFSENSKISNIFDNESVRVLLKDNELKEMLAVFPIFKPVFQNPLKKATPEMLQKLNDDDLFNIWKYTSQPQEMSILPYIVDAGRKVFSTEIQSFQISGTEKRPIGTKKTLFRKDGQVSRIENAAQGYPGQTEEIYHYDEFGKLQHVRFPGKEKLIQHHYFDGQPSFTENLQINAYRSSSYRRSIELELNQTHFVFNGNNRYSIQFSTVGGSANRLNVGIRRMGSEKRCTDSYCILHDSNGKILAVKNLVFIGMDILLNDKNKPLEVYNDYDRYRNFFEYDDLNRIRKYTYISDGLLNTHTTYRYTGDAEKPLTISYTNYSGGHMTQMVQEYKILYWEE